MKWRHKLVKRGLLSNIIEYHDGWRTRSFKSACSYHLYTKLKCLLCKLGIHSFKDYFNMRLLKCRYCKKDCKK